MLFHKKFKANFGIAELFLLKETTPNQHDEMKLRAKFVFFCVAARVYEGASYQLFEKCLNILCR